jgi:hypothetical protein
VSAWNILPQTTMDGRRPIVRRLSLILLAICALTLVTAGPAAAYQPVDIVHTERVRVGPYNLTVGFTT